MAQSDSDDGDRPPEDNVEDPLPPDEPEDGAQQVLGPEFSKERQDRNLPLPSNN